MVQKAKQSWFFLLSLTIFLKLKFACALSRRCSINSSTGAEAYVPMSYRALGVGQPF